jgi:hypothetical protein
VLVGRGVGDDVVLVVVPTKSPMCESSQASHGGPATHDVSYRYIPSDELRDTPFWFSEASKNNHGAGGFAGRKPGPHCWHTRQFANHFSLSYWMIWSELGLLPQNHCWSVRENAR